MNIITWILTIALGAMVILSGIFKITKNKKITEMLGKLGVAKYIPLFGIAEIIFALLFIYPATRNIGFVLLICYKSYSSDSLINPRWSDLDRSLCYDSPSFALKPRIICKYIASSC